MKKIFKIIAIILFSWQITAQEQKPKNRFYFSIHSGYNLSSGNTENINTGFLRLGWPGFNVEQNGTTTTSSNSKFNMGSGISYGGSFGYNFNKYLGSEVAVSYLKSESDINYRLSNSRTINNFNSKMLQIKPCLIVSAGFEKIDPFIKFGLVLGKISINNNVELGNAVLSRQYTFLYDGGLAVGYTGAFGINYNLGNNLLISLDTNFINLSYSPKKQTFTQFSENGVDKTSLIVNPVREEYFDELEEDPSFVPDPNAPQKRTSESISFGSFGFNLGVKYGF